MVILSGSCLCGTVKFEVKVEFESFYFCHCQYCQKDAGAGNAANLFANSAQLFWRSGTDAVASLSQRYHLPLTFSRPAVRNGIMRYPNYQGAMTVGSF